MSTIGSGIAGVVQGEAPARGKAGQGQAGETSGAGGFATTIASLQARDGHGGRGSARLSIHGGEQDGEQVNGARAKRGHRGPMLADALGKPGADASGKEASPDAETMLAGAAGRSGRKVHGEGRGEAAAHGAEGETGPDATAGETNVGSLLDLLAAPGAAMAQAGARGSAGTEPDGKAGIEGRAAAKADMQADLAADASDPVDGGHAPKSKSDKLFRLIRADGKGRGLDMSIGGDRVSLRDANPAGPKGETVTVVDSRRYIGLAQTGNAAAVTTAIARDPQWAASLSATGSLTQPDAATGKVVNTLKIQMHPIELGLVTATLRLHGDELVVSLQVETGEAYRQLADDQDAIVRALRGQGFAVDQVSVQLAPADRSANAQGGDQGQQQPQQFSGQSQAREGGDGGGQRGSEGTGTFGREGISHEGNTSETAPGLSGGQPVRSGGVYL